MRKHKNKIIATAVILAVLAGAWFYGGNYGKGKSDTPLAMAADPSQTAALSDGNAGAAISPAPGAAGGGTAQETQPAPSQSVPAPGSAESNAAPDDNSGTGDPLIPNSEFTAPNSEIPQASPESAPPATPNATPTMDIDPETGKDQYYTDPVPSGKPLPVELQDVTVGDGEFTVTLSVRCDTILDNMDMLDREKHELVPEDGVLFPATVVTVYEGESVFNVLHREMRRARIHMAFRNTPIYNSAYIEAINNLYEFDVGELSGWMYCVNGWYPNYGCSRYQLKSGDVIEWKYTCNMGRDLGRGADFMSGGQRDE